MTRRNGKIELMRFVFALCILLGHINLKVWENAKTFGPVSLARRGYLGVEFFFLVAGFLLAKTVARQNEAGAAESVGQDTAWFLWRKIRGLLPYHLIVCALAAISLALRAPAHMPDTLLLRLPGVLFLQNTGMLGNTNPLIAMEWYLSAMLIAMAILYPLARKWYRTTTRYLAPLLAVLLLGWMIHETGYISGTREYLGFWFKSNWRAIAEIALGMSCYEVSQTLSRRTWTRIQRVWITVIELSCYALTLGYMFSEMGSEYELLILLLLTVAVTLSFSDMGILTCAPFDNGVCYYLGSITLPLYLVQEICWTAVQYWLGDMRPRNQAVLIFASSILLAVLLYAGVSRWKGRKVEA